MSDIRPLHSITQTDTQRLIVGYTTQERYVITCRESSEVTTLEARLQRLDAPLTIRYDDTDDDTLQRYQEVLREGCSFGAYAGEMLVGLAIVEQQFWNNTLWVWEFHIAPDQRGQGTGRRLMERLIAEGQARGCRAIVCETQNNNVPAIRFYRALGFTLDGIDTSYYTNADLDKQDVAVFMKRRL